MKLKLKNFRCYQEKEFDFGTDGLVLLSGSSGCGKSTIMAAITFVLYGTGNKVMSYGKTNCQVEMEFDEIYITRTKRPNFLKLNSNSNEYENEAAQSIINEKFGNAFDITSYVQQNAYNSFILMSPLDKLAFLERFALNGIDLTKIKGKCQSIIKKNNEELISVTSQLQITNDHFNSLVKPTKVSFPIKTNNKENTIKNEAIRLKNTKVLIKRTRKELFILNEQLRDTTIYQNQISSKHELIKSLTEKILRDREMCSGIKYEGDDNLDNYESDLKLMISMRELSVMREKYEQDQMRFKCMQESEKEENQKEIDNIKSILWKEYSLEDIEKSIGEYRQILTDLEKLFRLKDIQEKNKIDIGLLEKNKELYSKSKQELENKREILSKLILQSESYTCPSCEVTLHFKDDKLNIFQSENIYEYDIEDVKKEIHTLNKTITRLEYSIPNDENKLKLYNEATNNINTIYSQYETELPSKHEIDDSIEYLKEYKKSQIELEKKKTKLETTNTLSNSLEIFKNQLSKQKENIKLKSNQFKTKTFEYDEDTLRKKIFDQRQNKEKLNIYSQNIKKLNYELDTVTSSLSDIQQSFSSKYSSVREIEDIKKDILDKTDTLSNLEKQEKVHEYNIEKIEEYKRYKDDLKTYIEWNKKVQVLSESETTARKKYAASTLLKEKILEAESLAILNVINSINIHAQEYLDIFFPHDPIVVRLLPFKETKKNIKPQINIEIDYKGMEADINMLSGGEIARVILAFTLALAEIFNSPLILLDESTASLDQEMTSVVMEGIRKNFGNKLVMIIAHQVISGEFDRQISL